jgi:hypothetical protein
VVSYQVAGVSTAVAPSSRSSSGKSQGGAVGLNVAEALAVVALLRVGGPGLRANVGLMAWLSVPDQHIVSSWDAEFASMFVPGCLPVKVRATSAL